MTLAAPTFVRPTYVSPVLNPVSTGGDRVAWAETHLPILKGPKAGQPLELLFWQKWVIERLYEQRPEGGNRYRRGLIGVGRQNGKSIIGGTLALNALFTGPPGSEVYSAAGDRQQARIVFGEARRQVLESPTLAPLAKVFRDAIEIPSTGSVYRVLSSDAKLNQGLSPYLVIFDEVHVQPSEDLYDALSLGMGARPEAIILGITTAGHDFDTLCGRLYEYGKKTVSGEIDDPSFFFSWWEAPEKAEIDDVDAWHAANPSLAEGMLLEEDMMTAMRQQQPVAFRRYKLNQWVNLGGQGWLDVRAWDAIKVDDWRPTEGSQIVVGFDGSVDRDATALVAIEVSGGSRDVPVAWPVRIWEPPHDDEDWQVPRDEVEAAVSSLFESHDVVLFAADPAWWRTELQQWRDRFGEKRVLDWPVTNARMGPSTASAYAQIMNHEIEQSGDPTLRRHIENAVAKDLGDKGVTLKKIKPRSPRKIDAAVALVIAVDMLDRYATHKAPGRLILF